MHGGVFECGGGFFGGGAQGGVGFETRGHPRHMADGVAEGGNVHIVVRGLRADYHVAHFQPAAQAACAAGIDDEIGAVLQHQGGAERGVHFADAA